MSVCFYILMHRKMFLSHDWQIFSVRALTHNTRGINGRCSSDHIIQWRTNINYILYKEHVRINLFSDTKDNKNSASSSLSEYSSSVFVYTGFGNSATTLTLLCNSVCSGHAIFGKINTQDEKNMIAPGVNSPNGNYCFYSKESLCQIFDQAESVMAEHWSRLVGATPRLYFCESPHIWLAWFMAYSTLTKTFDKSLWEECVKEILLESVPLKKWAGTIVMIFLFKMYFLFPKMTEQHQRVRSVK